MADLKLGMIGLDTSHVKIFVQLLNETENEQHVSGGRVVIGYPGGSSDFKLSMDRVEGYTSELRDNYGIKIVDTPEQVADFADAILLTAVDGRSHLDLFRTIAPFGKPVFIDKPLTVSYKDAVAIMKIAEHYKVTVMSCSVRRYAQRILQAKTNNDYGAIVNVDCFGTLAFESTQPGFFWYGIHIVECLYALLGSGCKEVITFAGEASDIVIGTWEDGRVGSMRGNHLLNKSQGVWIHREKATEFIDTSVEEKSKYVTMLEQIIKMCNTGKSDIDPLETIEIIRFIEAANESRITGKTVRL
ncbi:Oxidoreductase family, NAD-binding Rossmann fold [Paenibacillus sp. yr247]|uniref:Gfo/Idh/MocA family protein n=1 Tax=Paenibacillus sp. yr247 TaxID=1761880 RepID=UPI00088232F2|nr:Gfo/Idh/MocA family oxidoreductase [Paenibacillus sp. yr247]SDO37796.1 Oxidoreductase family, NAD-binding Rossmann fold [Paenibacillus sp. yr247]